MSVKIAATADLHFRPKRAAEVLASLATLERESRERGVQLIAISGDLGDAALFNTSSSRFPEFVEAIRSLADVAPVVMVYGTPSHDIAGSLDVFESLESTYGITILQPGHAYFIAGLLVFGIPEPHKGWLLAGKPATGPEETKAAMQEGMRALLLGLAAQRKQHPDIPCLVLYHGQIRGATMDNGQVVENAIGRDDLAMIGADYYALGDIHQPQQIGDLPAYYPGSAYPTNWGETHQCGFNVVTITPEKNVGGQVGVHPEEGGLVRFDEQWVTYRAQVERVDYPHPQQSVVTISYDDLTYSGGVDWEKIALGNKIKLVVECTREEASGIDIADYEHVLRSKGAHPESMVTLKIEQTETVRAGEIAEAKRLREKLGIFAENSQQEVAESVLVKADVLEADAVQHGAREGAWIKLRKLILRGAIGIWKGQGVDDIEVDLEEYAPGLVGLLWPNGGGKTTLLENMHPWPQLLTRDGKLSGHFRLKDSYRDLTWVDERSGDEYRALLQINGTSKAGEIDYLLYRNGALVDGINGRKEPYVAAIDELWGGLDLYLRSAFVSQKDAGLADSTKGERKALMVELSGLDYLQGYAESAKARARAITDELATDAGWITATEEQLHKLPDLQHARAQKDQAIRGGEEAVRKHELAVETARTEHDAMAAKVEANNALIRESRELTIRDEKLKNEADALRRNRETWAAAVAQREHAAECIANWEELDGERKKLEASKAAKLGKRNEALEQYNTAREAHERTLRELEAQQHTAAATLSALQRDRAEALAAVEMLGELLDKPRHDTCPACGAALPWAEREETDREKWQAQLSANQTAVWELDKKIPDAEETAKTVALSLAGLTEPERPRFAALPEDAELARVAADQEYLAIAEARETVTKAREAAVRIEEIDGRLVAIAEERTGIDTRQGELFTLVDEELDARFAECAARLEAARREHADVRETLSALRAEAEAIGRQIEDLQQKAQKLEERRAAVATKRRDADEWSWLQKACGPDGIQALELDALAPSIEDVANRLLSSAYGSRFSVRFATTKMSADGKRQLEDFLIMIADNEHGDEQELSVLSGGESVWIRRALYDAFGIIRARNTGLRFLTAFQDESDGALDPEHREHYARMIEAAHVESGRHHTIMITHSAEVQEMLSQRIEVSAPEATEQKVSA